jgi:2-methylisocitrate lyase-like PEP mutase family enzyme
MWLLMTDTEFNCSSFIPALLILYPRKLEGSVMTVQQQKFEQFRDLHFRENAFVVPNPWDAGSTRILSSMGFQALATTSAGYAFSVGKRDSFAGLGSDEILANAKAIVEATDLPVTADLEDGFGARPEACAETIKLAIEIGLVGGSIEDATGDAENPIYVLDAAVERIQSAVEAASGQPFLLTARAENFLWGRRDIDDTIKRLQAFSEAGADVLYAPGLPDIETIKTVCDAVDKPVNVVMGLGRQAYSVKALSEVGVSRISVGGSFARAALGALKRAAEEVLNNGTFNYASEAMPGKLISQLMSQDKCDDR